MQSSRLFLRAIPSDRTLIERSAKNPPFAVVVARARYLVESAADDADLLLRAVGETPCRLIVDVATPELFDSRVASDRDARRLRESGIGRSVEPPLTVERLREPTVRAGLLEASVAAQPAKAQ